MKIKEAINILKKQKIIGRTPSGRVIHDRAMEFLDATIVDEKNYESEVAQCKNCKFIVSINLTMDGCPNCGIEELTTQIEE